MIKSINLKNRMKYNDHSDKTVELISTFQASLYEQIVNMATLGKWKGWSDKKETGAIVQFEDDVLRNIDDQNIIKLFALFDKSNEIKEQITKG